MIEIALSLAIIGFALVAIIGVLPTGMTVQRENREETIIQQDASVLMDAIRNGERGLDDLTNYVMAITNYAYDFRPGSLVQAQKCWRGYTLNSSAFLPSIGLADSPPMCLTNGLRIIGLLSTPTYIPDGHGGYYSNHVVGYFRSMSGPASEKAPQDNAVVKDLGLSYKVIAEVMPYIAYDTNAWPTNFAYYWATVTNLQAVNLSDVRLTFRWPLLANGNTGSGRQVFRTMVSGPIAVVKDPIDSSHWFTNYLFQPNSYTNVNLP